MTPVNLAELKRLAELGAQGVNHAYRYHHADWLKFREEITPQQVLALIEALEEAQAAIVQLGKHNGGCDGPLGCMCSAPRANSAIAKIRTLVDFGGGE